MMKIHPELKGIAVILLIALVLGILLAGTSGKLEQWGLPWFTGAKATDKIIFVSDRSGSRQIYIMGTDGSNQKQLTQGVQVLSPPAISPAGNKIAFVGMAGTGDQVLAIGIDGGSGRALTTSTNSKRLANFSPDGKKLSYIEAGRVFAAELNGGNPEPILPTEEEMAQAINDPSGGRGDIPKYSTYAWGPDSDSLAGVTNSGGAETLVYLPTLKGEAEALRFGLGDPTAKVEGMSWAVDRPLLAVSIQSPKQGVVALLDPDQKQPRLIFSAPAHVGPPALSPDGATVFLPAMPATKTPAPVLLRIDTQSGKAAVLCKGFFEGLTFSPKGDSILAAQFNPTTRKRSIVTINPESGKVTTLATEGDNFDATWSPQSK